MGRTFRCSYANNKRYAKIMLIFLASLLILMTIITFSMGMTAKNKSFSNSSSITMEVSRKRVLKGENINVKLPMASTTKVMTAYLACKSGKLNEIVTITKDMQGIEGSSIYLQTGEKYKLIDLVFGLMLQSGNDSAVAIAKFLGGSIENFAKLMNTTAKRMGLNNTNFVNPHGLHNDNHYTTAYDLAYITAVALKNKDFRRICSATSYCFTTVDGINKCYMNKNKMLKMYDGCIGVKTGYTKKAGRCLVSAAQKNGVEMVSVVLNKYDMWNDSIENLNYGFDKAKHIKLLNKNCVLGKVLTQDGQLLQLGVTKDIGYTIFSDEKINFTHNIILNKNLPKNVEKGEFVGKINFFADNHLLFSEKIYNI